jgi:hypothetical protein
MADGLQMVFQRITINGFVAFFPIWRQHHDPHLRPHQRKKYPIGLGIFAFVQVGEIHYATVPVPKLLKTLAPIHADHSFAGVMGFSIRR